MRVFSGAAGRSEPPSLADPQVLSLLYAAVEGSNYQAVVSLYNRYARGVRREELWDVWLDQAADAAHEGRAQSARLALSFARMAAVEPWGPLTEQQHARIRALDTLLSVRTA